ncbi:MAG: hypothetical protein K0S32_2419 [Bacteroidetes bacterium]|jgi:hypothetical protein|nr:hypothetical protein [Bacteroidota bacterium]
MIRLLKFPFLVLILAFTCCKNKSISTASEYNNWLNDPENHCKLSREVNGMIIDVKYLPENYLALKESEGDRNKFDSLSETYKGSTTFLISFKPKEGHKGDDVMFRNVEDYKAYIERSLELNFDLESKIVLKTTGDSYAPVLSSLENTYGLTKGRQVYLVFTEKTSKEEIKKSDVLDFIYTDDIYQLGILHFTFDHKTIRKSLPQIELNHF